MQCLFVLHRIALKHKQVIPSYFATGDLLSHTTQYQTYFMHSSIIATYEKLVSCGEYHKTSKRSLAVYCYGCTIMATWYPMFILPNGKHCILPRPYQKSKPGNTGFNLMMQPWFRDLVADVESAVKFLFQVYYLIKKKRKDFRTVLNLLRNSYLLNAELLDHFLHICR